MPRISPTPLQQPERILPFQQFSHPSVDSNDTLEVQRLPLLQQEAMKCQDETVRLVATGLERFEMPKRELIYFDGELMRYPRFIKGSCKQPYAVRTPLGWTLIGPLGQASSSDAQVNFVSGGQELLSTQFKRLYDAEFSESQSCTKQAFSVEDHRALTILEGSARKVDGHYQLSLPWRFRTPCSQNNRSVAVRRLHALEKRFRYDPALFEMYRDTINEYIVSYRHSVKSLPFSLSLLGDVTDKVRIVVFMHLVLFVLIFVSLVIYVNAYFLIDCS